jgi:hypothetical protein
VKNQGGALNATLEEEKQNKRKGFRKREEVRAVVGKRRNFDATQKPNQPNKTKEEKGKEEGKKNVWRV